MVLGEERLYFCIYQPWRIAGNVPGPEPSPLWQYPDLNTVQPTPLDPTGKRSHIGALILVYFFYDFGYCI
jgi:hypothetical protein